MIELDDTTSIGVEGALSLPVSAPVPEEYAKPYDAENPSTYGVHQVASGPYMIENDAEGELTGYTPNKEIHLVRNPNWEPSDGDHRPAYLDEITIQEGFADTVSAGKKILDRQRPGQRGLHRPAVGDQAGGDVGRVRAADADAKRGQPLRVAEHHGAAVRRHQRPQGRDRKREPHGPAQHPRR